MDEDDVWRDRGGTVRDTKEEGHGGQNVKGNDVNENEGK